MGEVIRKQPTRTLRYKGSKPDIFGVVIFGQRIGLDHLAQRLIGKLVGIVILDSLDALRNEIHSEHVGIDVGYGTRESTIPQRGYPTIVPTTHEHLPYIMADVNQTISIDPWKSQCVGLAIVADIDREDGSISLQTPVTIEDIQRVVDTGRRHVILVGPSNGEPN